MATKKICPNCGDKCTGYTCPGCGTSLSNAKEIEVDEYRTISAPNNYEAKTLHKTYQSMYNDGSKTLLYVISVLFAIIGLLVGAFMLTSDDSYKRELGKNCAIISIISSILCIIILSFII